MLVGHAVQQAFRHQATPHRREQTDVRLPHGDVLPFQPAQHEDLGVALDEEAAERATIVRGDGEILETFADLGVGVHDADEHRAEVVALVGGQFRTDPSALEEEFVTRGALLLEERLAGIRITRAGLELGFDVGDLGDEVRDAGRRLFRIEFRQQPLHLLGLMLPHAFDHVARHGVRGDPARPDGFQQLLRPLRAAGEQGQRGETHLAGTLLDDRHRLGADLGLTVGHERDEGGLT